MAGEPRVCPHCGATPGHAGDAFCPDCRGRLGDTQMGGDGAADDHAVPLTLASLLPANGTGFALIAASFLPALGVCYLVGDDRDGLKLTVGGPLALGLDLMYRLRSPDGHWLLPGRGGKFAFLPLWVFGIFWFCTGIWELIHDG